MKFMCLAYEEESIFHEMSEADWHALRLETLDYVRLLEEKGHLIATHPLRSATSARTVRVRDNKLSVTDGAFAETKEQIGGYFLIEAQDFDEAVALAAKWPSARLGSIEVRPVEEGLSMETRYKA